MKVMTRQAAIGDLRRALVAAAGEHSICRVAQEKDLFCRGFGQWKLHELKQRYPQITRSRSRLSRSEMEDLADRWQLARQFVRGESLACDVQMQEGQLRTCDAWEGFGDDELERFHLELCGEEIRIEEPLEQSTCAR